MEQLIVIRAMRTGQFCRLIKVANYDDKFLRVFEEVYRSTLNDSTIHSAEEVNAVLPSRMLRRGYTIEVMKPEILTFSLS